MASKTVFFHENDDSRRNIASFFCEDSERHDDRRESSLMIGERGSMIGGSGAMGLSCWREMLSLQCLR